MESKARGVGGHKERVSGQARGVCPKGGCIDGQVEEHAGCWERVFAGLESVTRAVEGWSLDEDYLDFTGCARLQGMEGWAAMEEGRPGRVVELAERLGIHQQFQPGERLARGDDLPRLGLGAQTSREVGHGTDGGVIPTALGTEGGVTRGDADTGATRRSVAFGYLVRRR